MKGYIYIDDDLIGKAFFKVIDESMGAVGGELIPSRLYDKYKSQLQGLYEKHGVANMESLNFKILLDNKNTSILKVE
ncbi:MAG: hypothetical protein V4560_08060 [Bacteroidota bacterium]